MFLIERREISGILMGLDDDLYSRRMKLKKDRMALHSLCLYVHADVHLKIVRDFIRRDDA